MRSSRSGTSRGALYVYHITGLGSFDALGDWPNHLSMLSAPNLYVFRVQNKTEWAKLRPVGDDPVKDCADRHHQGALYVIRDIDAIREECEKNVHSKSRRGSQERLQCTSAFVVSLSAEYPLCPNNRVCGRFFLECNSGFEPRKIGSQKEGPAL
jgi:hypothetical protein